VCRPVVVNRGPFRDLPPKLPCDKDPTGLLRRWEATPPTPHGKSTVSMYIPLNVSVMFLMLFVDSGNRDACRI